MIYYIYADNKQEFIDAGKEYLADKHVKYLPFSGLGKLDVSDATHLVVTGCLDEIKLLMLIAHQNDISLGIVPSGEQKELINTFGLSSKQEDAMAQALHVSDEKIDLLYCNAEIVLQEVVVGDAPPLDRFDSTLNGKSYLDRVKIFWRTLKRVKTLKHTQMKITDAKENEIKLSAVGVVGIEYANNTFA